MFYFSVMEKMGRDIPTLHQVCHSHGIHLAVCDVLYKDISHAIADPEADLEEYESSSDEEDMIDLASEEENESDSDSDEDEATEASATHNITLANSFKDIIAKVRKICKLMRKSRKTNDCLRKYCTEDPEIGKGMKLKIDVKTRW